MIQKNNRFKIIWTFDSANNLCGNISADLVLPSINENVSYNFRYFRWFSVALGHPPPRSATRVQGSDLGSFFKGAASWLRHGPESSDLNPRPLYLETMDFSCVKKFATIKSDIGFLRLVIWLVFQQEEGLAQANISGIGSNIS